MNIPAEEKIEQQKKYLQMRINYSFWVELSANEALKLQLIADLTEIIAKNGESTINCWPDAGRFTYIRMVHNISKQDEQTVHKYWKTKF